MLTISHFLSLSFKERFLAPWKDPDDDDDGDHNDDINNNNDSNDLEILKT